MGSKSFETRNTSLGPTPIDLVDLCWEFLYEDLIDLHRSIILSFWGLLTPTKCGCILLLGLLMLVPCRICSHNSLDRWTNRQ